MDLFRVQYLFVIKLTRANACLFNARDTLLTVAWFRGFTSSFLYLRSTVVHTKTIFTRVNIFTHSSRRFQIYPVCVGVLLGYVWTEAVTVKIFTRFQSYTGTCGRSLTHITTLSTKLAPLELLGPVYTMTLRLALR